MTPLTRRLTASLTCGALTGAAMVLYEDTRQHAALAAAAARPDASGQHQSVTFILASGFTAVAVMVTVIIFVIATISARTRARRWYRDAARDSGARRPAPRRHAERW
jgi:heme/copper-type cytochrome/quinol oxidase subunit 2